MFNPTALVIDAFVEELKQAYTATYTTLEPDYPGIIAYVGHMALELIANSFRCRRITSGGPNPNIRHCYERRTSSGNWPTSTTCGRDRRSSWNSLRPARTRSSATRPPPNCVPRIPRSFGRQ